MLQDLLNNIWVFNRSDDSNGSTALFTFLYFNAKDALQPLRPRHRIGLVLPSLQDLLRFIFSLPRHDILSQLTPRGENPMKPCKVHPGLRNQCRQAPYKLYWAQDNVGGSIIVDRKPRTTSTNISLLSTGYVNILLQREHTTIFTLFSLKLRTAMTMQVGLTLWMVRVLAMTAVGLKQMHSG